MIVTIDGPAGTGKSTVAKRVAAELSYEYLDTGAMYRMVGWYILKTGIEPKDEQAVIEALPDLALTFDDGHALLNGEDVTSELRSPEVTCAASYVAKIPQVRQQLVDAQRMIAAAKDIVCEGRDQGTVVFPQAECKFFLTATPEIRAERRMLEMEKRGESVNFQDLLQEQTERDRRDEERTIAPLKPADDAEIVDTSDLDIEAVVQQLVEAVKKCANC